MNTFKKIGLTALAGSLVVTSAYAGSMSVSGHSSQQHNPSRDGVSYLPYPNPYRPQFNGDLGLEVLKKLDEFKKYWI